MSRRREARPLAEHYGDLVRVALMEARPAGLHTYQLMAATRLTCSQVGAHVSGYASFQPLYQKITREQPDLFD